MIPGFVLAIFLFFFLYSVSEPATIDWGGIGGRIGGKYLSRRFWISFGLYAQATSPCGGDSLYFLLLPVLSRTRVDASGLCTSDTIVSLQNISTCDPLLIYPISFTVCI